MTLPPLRPGRMAVHESFSSTALAIGPILLVLLNAFKTRRAIFADPLGFPDGRTFTTIGFDQVFAKSGVGLYFFNSITVTVVSLALIVLIGAMAAWALSEYRFPGNTFLALYLALGIMVPIRLGSVSILRMMVELNLVNADRPRAGLRRPGPAHGHPDPRRIHPADPRDLRDAALRRGQRVPDLRQHHPALIRPAIATWRCSRWCRSGTTSGFPLILAPGDGKQTVTLGVQQFIGQYVTDWNAVLAALSLAIAPVLVLYLLFSRYLVRGLTAGAIK